MTRRIGWVLLGWLAATMSQAAAPHVPALKDAHGDPLPDGAVARLGTVRWRAGMFIAGFAWSPDGKWIASADAHGRTVRLWEASSGRVVRTFWGHRDHVTRVAFSPDGKRLASASSDKTARIWDVQSGKSLARLAGLEKHAYQVAFSRDGKTVAVMSLTGQVIRYEADTGKELNRFQAERQVFSHALSPRGDRVGGVFHDTKTRNNRLVVQDPIAGKTLREFKIGDRLGEAAFSPDGKLVALRLYQAGVKVWRISDGKELLSLSNEEGGIDGRLLFTPDGKALLGDHAPGKSRLWDVATGKRVQSFTGLSHSQHPRDFSPDGKRLVNIDHQNRMRFWDVAKGREVTPAPGGMDGPVFGLAFSTDGKRLFSGGGYGAAARLWDVRTRKVVREFPISGDPFLSMYGVALSRDGKKAAAVGGGVVIVWDTATGKELLRPAPMKDVQLFAVLFSPDSGTLFATGYNSGVLRWDLKAGKALEPLRSDLIKTSRELQLSPDGKSLVVNGAGVMTFWDLATGAFQRSVKVAAGPHTLFSRLSPDGKRIAAFDYRGGVVLSAAEDGKVLRTWRGTGIDADLRFSPDGKLLVGIAGRAFYVWQTDAELPPSAIVGEPDNVRGLAFSPDGKWLATSGYSTAILLWDVRSLRRLPPYRMPAGEWELCWDSLAGTEPYHATRTRALLHAGGDLTVSRVRERLWPAPIDAKRAERLLRVVNGEDDDAADRAAGELVALGPGVRPLIEKALKGKLDPDARLRLVVARSKLPGPDPAEESRRVPLVVSVLRQIGTKAGKAVLDDLEAGKAGTVWARAVKDAKD